MNNYSNNKRWVSDGFTEEASVDVMSPPPPPRNASAPARNQKKHAPD